MFRMPPVETFSQTRVFALNYPLLLTGVGSLTLFTGISDFAVQPAVAYSATEETLYAPNHNSSGSANYRLNTITRTSASPVYTQGVLQTRTGGGWAKPSGNILPQQCLSNCPRPVAADRHRRLAHH